MQTLLLQGGFFMNKKISLILFSGEFDKALAALILANEARDMGSEVNIFCAFWGLLLIRDPHKMSTEDKSIYEKMFGAMTAKGAEELPLSRMNYAGIGKKMLSAMMEDTDTPPLEAFLKGALDKGVKFHVCKLSAEVMGFAKEEFLDGVNIVTAKEYLTQAAEADVELFI